jgi:hypothetical protein
VITVLAWNWSAEEDHGEPQISFGGTSREGVGQCMKRGDDSGTMRNVLASCATVSG